MFQASEPFRPDVPVEICRALALTIFCRSMSFMSPAQPACSSAYGNPLNSNVVGNGIVPAGEVRNTLHPRVNSGAVFNRGSGTTLNNFAGAMLNKYGGIPFEADAMPSNYGRYAGALINDRAFNIAVGVYLAGVPQCREYRTPV